MGSSRIRGTDLAARCCYGAFYALGFLTTTLIFMAMLWILWCYFGLALVHLSDGQRRAVVHYSLPSSKPQTSSTVLPNQGDDSLKSIPKTVTSSSSFSKDSSRDLSISSSLLHEAGDEKGSIPPSDEDDDGIQVRRVASSNDNRHGLSNSPKDAQKTGNIDNPKVQHPPNLTSDAKSVGASKNTTSSKELGDRRDESQSSRSSDVASKHTDIDSPNSPNRPMIAEDDSRGSKSRYDSRYRGSDRGGEADDSYSKGDTRLHRGKTADDTYHRDDRIHSHVEGSHDDPPRRRGDDDRYADYDDAYKSHDDRPYYREERYKTYEGRHRLRDDDRYTPRDDDKYRSLDEERYRLKDGEDGRTRDDRLKDHGRDTSRDEDRYRTRYIDRSRDGDRYITRDDDKDRDRYRDDDRDSYRDEGRSRTRYRDGDRSRYGDDYRPRVGYRDTEDVLPERGSQNTRYVEKDDYYTRGDEDRYRDDSRTKERDYRVPVTSSRDGPEDYPSRASSAGNSKLDVPPRTILSESNYEDTDRGDGYRRPTRYHDRDRISPTRVEDDTYSSRPTLMDSRSRSEISKPALADSRRMDDDRFSQGSRRYQDDSRREYRTRMPDENTKYAPRYEDDLALERRSYGSEEDDEYTSRTRYYDDRSGTRRYFRNRDDEYPRRSRPDDDEEYTRRRTDDDEEYSRRRTDDEEDFRRSRPREPSRSRHRDRYEDYGRDDDRYDDDRIRRRNDDRPRRQDNLRKEVVSDSSTGERPFRGSVDSRDTPKRIEPDERDDADGSPTVERPLSAKDVIDAALRQSDMNEKNPVRKVSYPVFDPRVSNLTSPEIIRPSERRGITIHSRKKRSLRV